MEVTGDFADGIRNAHVMHGRVEAAHALWISLYPDHVIHPTLSELFLLSSLVLSYNS